MFIWPTNRRAVSLQNGQFGGYLLRRASPAGGTRGADVAGVGVLSHQPHGLQPTSSDHDGRARQLTRCVVFPEYARRRRPPELRDDGQRLVQPRGALRPRGEGHPEHLEFRGHPAGAQSTRLAAALRRFWWIRGHTVEARTWYTTLVERARRDQGRCGDALGTLARALTSAALFAYLQGASAALGLQASEAVALCRRLDERDTLAEALHLLGHYYLEPGTDYEAARAHFDDSAAQYRAVGDIWGVGWSLHCMATSVWQLGDNETARLAYEESLRLFLSVGDENMAAHPIGALGCLAFDGGERGRGRELVEASVARFRAFNDRHYLALQLHRGGYLACAAGDAKAAYRAYHESLTLAVESGFSDQISYALEGFAMLAAAQAQPERALYLAGAAAVVRVTTGRPRKPAERPRLQQALAAARAALGSAEEAVWQRGRRMTPQQAVDAALAALVGPGGPSHVSYRRARGSA